MSDGGITVTADGMWGASCLAYNVQGTLEGDALDAIEKVQGNLLDAGLPSLNLCPRHSLHVSIYAIVPVRQSMLGKEGYWAAVSAGSIADLDRLCRGRPNVALRFSELRVTPAAVIAVADAMPDLSMTFASTFPGRPSRRAGSARPTTSCM